MRWITSTIPNIIIQFRRHNHFSLQYYLISTLLQAIMEPDNQGFDNKPTQIVAVVRVTEPQADSVKGFYTYLVSGTDELGTFEIRRRYNDFFFLREALKKKWPGIYIPPIPEKKLTGNKDVENIETRRKFFQYFLKKLAEIRHLFSTNPITQQFLRNKTLDMEKFFSTISAPKTAELVFDYKKIYSGLDFKSTKISDANNGITSFGGYLKRADKELKNLRGQVQTIVDARNAFTQHLNNCNQVMLPEYEKNVYIEYLSDEQKKQPSLIFVNNHRVQDNIRVLRDVSSQNSFDLCLDMITYESLEIEAMQEAIQIKESYEANKRKLDEKVLTDQAELAKLSGGKTTFKSFFSKGSKNEQIQIFEREIPELQKQIEHLGEFLNVMAVVFGISEIDRFKKLKQKQYYDMMQSVSENELKYLASYGEFMKSIMDGLQN